MYVHENGGLHPKNNLASFYVLDCLFLQKYTTVFFENGSDQNSTTGVAQQELQT